MTNERVNHLIGKHLAYLRRIKPLFARVDERGKQYLRDAQEDFKECLKILYAIKRGDKDVSDLVFMGDWLSREAKACVREAAHYRI